MLRVLFVCTGNICRSPIAHGLLEHRVKGLEGAAIEVRSAGTWGRNGNSATREAVAAAAGLGIDIAAHRASKFTGELGAWADLIITMTTEQSEEVRELVPDASPKTFTLKELVAILGSLPQAAATSREDLLKRIAEADRARENGFEPPVDLDVSDPLGHSETVYQAVAHELEGLVDELVAGLIGSDASALASEAEG